MKKAILTLGTLLCTLFFASAQTTPATLPATPAASAPAAPTSTAEIKFDKLEFDYGTLKQGGDPNGEFSFKNTGKEPLIISNCQGSCGCTVPSWPKEPIKPGASGVIKVHYDTKRVGPINKTVTVTSNSKDGVVTLHIKGLIEAAPAEETFPGTKSTGAAPVEKAN
ncbi:MAG TPA: DUF1573 domain-containing protein [Bacteroidia bacterium]|jgi:hypothetical protein|nr:DUF1573 domain-containing protein [Bacteroidia bacterium]